MHPGWSLPPLYPYDELIYESNQHFELISEPTLYAAQSALADEMVPEVEHLLEEGNRSISEGGAERKATSIENVCQFRLRHYRCYRGETTVFADRLECYELWPSNDQKNEGRVGEEVHG